MYVFTLKKYLNSGGWEKCVNDNKDRDICMNGTVSDSVLQFSPDTMQWTQVTISRRLQLAARPYPNIVKAVSKFRCELYPQVGRLTRARARHAVSLATVGDLAAAGLMVGHKDDVSQGIQKSYHSSRST